MSLRIVPMKHADANEFVRAALAELVACKALLDKLEDGLHPDHQTMYREYQRRICAAWDAADSALQNMDR